MNTLLIAFFAHIIDRLFGEFRFIKHPVILIGGLISFFEKRFYKDSVIRGLFLVMFVLALVTLVSLTLEMLLLQLDTLAYILISSFIASMFLAHRMLYDSVKNILDCEDQKKAISYLVSRDTEKMSQSDIYKAAIETYAENLSDGVVAPLFFLALFGLPGVIIYKAVNTMDSMVGYRNSRYEKYGKFAAKLDDALNYIPSRITALLLMLIFLQRDIFAFYKYGKKHESPNAGHPISAMALGVGVSLGGDTWYFQTLKKKPYFGEGRVEIQISDLQKALAVRNAVDITLLIFLACAFIITQYKG